METAHLDAVHQLTDSIAAEIGPIAALVEDAILVVQRVQLARERVAEMAGPLNDILAGIGEVAPADARQPLVELRRQMVSLFEKLADVQDQGMSLTGHCTQVQDEIGVFVAPLNRVLKDAEE